MEEQIIKITEILHRVTMDINSAECCLIGDAVKDQVYEDQHLRGLQKRLAQLWQDAYRIKMDFQKEVIV